MADSTPRFVLVKSVSPHNQGNFGRAGLRFTREWRPLEVAAVHALEKGVIDEAILARLVAETEMLAVKPATPEEVARFAETSAAGPQDKGAELAAERTKNAELEARLMRIEVGIQQAATTDPAEVAALRTKNAELEARLMRLETAKAPVPEPKAAKGATAPADPKSSPQG